MKRREKEEREREGGEGKYLAISEVNPGLDAKMRFFIFNTSYIDCKELRYKQVSSGKAFSSF